MTAAASTPEPVDVSLRVVIADLPDGMLYARAVRNGICVLVLARALYEVTRAASPSRLLALLGSFL